MTEQQSSLLLENQRLYHQIMFCAAGGHHEGLSAQKCGGDV